MGAKEPRTAVGTAPAKLILFGEHSVVYGQPALGMALSRGVTVTLRRGSGKVEVHLPSGIEAGDLPRSGATPAALVAAALGDAAEDIDAEIDVAVPPMAGLGTSAAIAVAALRARNTLDDRASPNLLDAAIAVENVAHGASSGLDPAICLDGGVISYRRGEGRSHVVPIKLTASFHLVIGARGSHGGTGDRVRAVRELGQRAPALVEATMDALGAAAKLGTSALEDGDLELAGRAMDVAHGILSGLGLVGDEVERLVRLARAKGALGAKMSGAGGRGGAFFALVPDIVHGNEIRELWSAEGVESWIETAS